MWVKNGSPYNAINPLTITRETNFFENTFYDKVITKKNYLAHNISSGLFFRVIKSIATF